MPRIVIDSSPVTHLPVCPCGWRGQTVRSLLEAHRQAAAHEEAEHAQDRTTRRHRQAGRI